MDHEHCSPDADRAVRDVEDGPPMNDALDVEGDAVVLAVVQIDGPEITSTGLPSFNSRSATPLLA